MDIAKRQKLIERMGAVHRYNGGFAPKEIVLVTPHDYYDGSEGEAGLLPDLDPEEHDILEFLESIAKKQNVDAVYVAITQCDDGEWPFGDKIVVVTTASDEQVLSWFSGPMAPDEIYERDELTQPAEQPDVPEGYREVWLWFD